MDKNSFVLYTNYYEILKDLSNEKLGELFRAILEYKTTKKQPVVSVDLLIVFKFIKNQLDVDEEKYLEKCRKRSENGKKGGAPKNNQNAKKQAKTTKNKLNKHNDNENDNDNVNDNEFIPTKDEIKNFANQQLGKSLNVDDFFNWYDAVHWKDKDGLPINWKQKVILWVKSQKSNETITAEPQNHYRQSYEVKLE